jgi:electron transfer flavoprotein alpha subunit
MKVLVCGESRDNQPERLFFELLTAGRSAADSGEVVALWIGPSDEAVRAQLGQADRAIAATDSRLASATAEVYATLLLKAIESEKPDLTIVGYTARGLDYGPAAATRAGLPMAVYVVGLERTEGPLVIHSQIYGGKMIARLEAAGSVLAMVSPGAFAEAPATPLDASRITKLDIGDALSSTKVHLIEETAPPQSDVDLAAAERIVCVGRGIGDEQSIDLARELSRLLGAEIAGSRPVVDNGWLPKPRQVGKSGQKVHPKLYLALGVSGAPEHLEGMSRSELIVAVNTDPNAPIFNVAHFTANCDLFDFVDCLTERLSELGAA